MRKWILPVSLSLMLPTLAGCGLFTPNTDPGLPTDTPEIVIDKARSIANSARDTSDEITVNPVGINNKMADYKTANTDKLFITSPQTTEERFTRLENHVQELHNTFADISPKISKLMTIESELGHLTFQLEKLLNKGENEGFPQASSPRSPTPVTNTVLPAQTGDADISNLRIGQHADKVRIVLETTDRLDYQAAFDNAENFLTVTFPSSNLSPALENKLNNITQRSRAVRSIILDKNNGNTLIVFDLTKTTSKMKSFRIGADKKHPHHRIVIDLFL